MLSTIITTLVKIILILIGVAYFTIAERKVMAAAQRRHGPDVVGFLGLLQPLADGLKLVVKELLIPTKTEPTGFLLAPIVILTLSLLSWSVIPFGFFDNTSSVKITVNEYMHEILISAVPANIKCGILFLLAVSSFNVYGIIIAGWSSNSKYAFLGALRSAAQMISYEVSIGLIILPIILLSASLNLTEIVLVQSKTIWFIFPLLPCAIVFFISMLAETNRAPFDLPEAEAELVAGYNVEYSSIIFAMFFLAEYSNMILMATIFTIFFLGGWSGGVFFFCIKITIFCFLFILVRAAFPRYRYDQLMNIGWKLFLPLLSGYLVFVVSILITTDSLLLNNNFF